MKSNRAIGPTTGAFLKRNELAVALNVCPRTIDLMRNRRFIPSYKLGHRTVLYSLPRVLEALEKLEVRTVG